jgi:hypothetical protein
VQKLDDAHLPLSLLRSELKGKDALADSLRKECDSLRELIDDRESKIEALSATLSLESSEVKRLSIACSAAPVRRSGATAPSPTSQARARDLQVRPISPFTIVLSLFSLPRECHLAYRCARTHQTPHTHTHFQDDLQQLRARHLTEITILQQRLAKVLRKCNASEAQQLEEIKELVSENEAGKALIQQLIARLSGKR